MGLIGFGRYTCQATQANGEVVPAAKVAADTQALGIVRPGRSVIAKAELDVSQVGEGGSHMGYDAQFPGDRQALLVQAAGGIVVSHQKGSGAEVIEDQRDARPVSKLPIQCQTLFQILATFGEAGGLACYVPQAAE